MPASRIEVDEIDLLHTFDFTKLSSKCHDLVGLWDYKLGWDGVRVHHSEGL
jgi:hypothetical protein